MGLGTIFTKVKDVLNTPNRIVLTSLLALNLANGVISYKGYIRPSHDGVSGGNTLVSAILQDTVVYNTMLDGKYLGMGSYHNPPAQPEQILNIEADKDTNNKSYECNTQVQLKDGNNFIYELALDDLDKPGKAYTINYKDICDTSSLTMTLPLHTVTWVNSFPGDTNWNIDTISDGSIAHPKFFDYYKNTEELFYTDSLVNGDTVWTKFFKFLPGDSIAYTLKYVVIGENTVGNAAVGDDTTYIYENIGSTGINESKLVSFPKYSSLSIRPTLTKDKIYYQNFSGLEQIVNLYDAAGKKVDTYEVDTEGYIDLTKHPAGVYFLKPEEQETKPTKVVKTE